MMVVPRRSIGSGSGAGPDASTGSGSNIDVPADANFIFVSSTMYSFATEQDQPTLDGECHRLAMMNPRMADRTFIAAYQTRHTMTVQDRLAGAHGFYRPDGRPVGDMWLDMLPGRIWYPVSLDELGNRLYAPVFTGLDELGQTGDDCLMTETTGVFGLSDTAGTIWITGHAPRGCSQPAHIYCISTDFAATPTAPTADPSGKHVWLSKAPYPGNGPTTANACNAGGLTGSPFVFDKNGVPLDPVPPADWYRSDGVFVGSDLAHLSAPVTTDQGGDYLGAGVWRGKAGVNGATNDTCDSWTGSTMLTGDYAESGDPQFLTTVPCTMSNYLLCFENP
ncbi:MAG: hypothetical protein QM831_06585 [Kofleriaceae bacterium]